MNWIEAKYLMPSTGKECGYSDNVLVFCRDYDDYSTCQRIAYYNFVEKRWEHDYHPQVWFTVTHWMWLPSEPDAD